MKELLEYILKEIVDDFSKIKIEEENEEENIIVYKIIADDDQKGAIIGREGRTIKSIRNLLGIKAVKEGKRVYVKVE
jgi:predicted RNA-binding protein YlqC (UPF0109 family)